MGSNWRGKSKLAKCIFVILSTNQIIREYLPSSRTSFVDLFRLPTEFWICIIFEFKGNCKVSWKPTFRDNTVIIINWVFTFFLNNNSVLQKMIYVCKCYYNHNKDAGKPNVEQKLEHQKKSFQTTFRQRWLVVSTAWWSKFKHWL